jgi:hypothetical protein
VRAARRNGPFIYAVRANSIELIWPRDDSHAS